MLTHMTVRTCPGRACTCGFEQREVALDVSVGGRDGSHMVSRVVPQRFHQPRTDNAPLVRVPVESRVLEPDRAGGDPDVTVVGRLFAEPARARILPAGLGRRAIPGGLGAGR
jgi:hypothetical protein